MADSPLDQLIIGNLSIAQSLEQFLLTRETKGLSPKTLVYYKGEITNFVNYAHNHQITNIFDVTPQTIRLFLQHVGQTRSKGGVHASWRAVRAMFLWYEEEMEPDGWKNPVRKIKVPIPRTNPIPGITMEDFLKLINVSRKGRDPIRDVALLYCLLDSCVRADEFININVRDVNLVTGDVLIRSGKGSKPRYVRFANAARKELRRYLKTRKDLKKEDPLFTTKAGKRFTYDGLWSFIRHKSYQAHIAQPGLHDFRRAGALEMLRNGADLVFISHYLGHNSLEVTMRYLAVTPTDLRKTHNKTSPVDNL